MTEKYHILNVLKVFSLLEFYLKEYHAIKSTLEPHHTLINASVYYQFYVLAYIKFLEATERSRKKLNISVV